MQVRHLKLKLRRLHGKLTFVQRGERGPEHSRVSACLFVTLYCVVALLWSYDNFSLGLLLEGQANDGKSLYPQGTYVEVVWMNRHEARVS